MIGGFGKASEDIEMPWDGMGSIDGVDIVRAVSVMEGGKS